MSFWLAIVLRPFALLVLLMIGWGIGELIKPLIPEGRVKRALYKSRKLVLDSRDYEDGGRLRLRQHG